jgi:hypothetical protein
MSPKRIGVALGITTALASGAYVFIYLYRWEWNRALIAGMFFVAAEIALLAVAVLDRLKRLDGRLNDIERQLVAPDRALARIQETAPPARRHFAWLTDMEGTGVFVPVLMGAGIVISGIAWAVEKIAHKTARPVLEQRLAGRLAPISLPGPGGDVAALPPPRAFRPMRAAGWLLMVAILVVGLVTLADATQNRPDDLSAGSSTTIAFDVYTNQGMDSLTAAQQLWQACSGTIPSRVQTRSFRATTDGSITVDVRPALGVYGERRLRGCLEDAMLDNIQAAVRTVDHSRP